MDSKPRKTRKDKGVKRKAKGKGKKIAKGAKKLFESDLLSIQRRPPPPRVSQQQQPVFNLNISQNLRNIVGAFASASTAANYAKTQEINRQAADASYRAETITQLSRDNFLASLEKQRLERKVERGERAYAGAVAQTDRVIRNTSQQVIGVMNQFYGAPQRRQASRQARVMEIVSMSDSDAPFEGFSDVPPSRQLSAEDVGIISRPMSRVASAEIGSPLVEVTPRRSLAEIQADERALAGESSEDVPRAGGFGGFGGGGSAYASEQYLQNQPRGRPVIVDAATARSERVNKKIAKITKVKEPKPRDELLLARQDADAIIAAARAKKAQVSASAADPVVVTGGVAVAGGGIGAEAPRKKIVIKLKPEAIARAAALESAAAAAAPSGSTTETESSGSLPRRSGGAAAASAPQRLRAAEIRSQLSAATGVTQKSLRFKQGIGSRKALAAVDWVATIADIQRRGLKGADAIEAIKQKHRDVLE